MPLTLTDIVERLKQIDELDLIEYLGITSEDIVDRFSDLIEDKIDKLEQIVEW